MSNYCCLMREHFLIGIIGEAPGLAPVEVADFIVDFDREKPLIVIKYCPFCGKPVDQKQPLRKIHE